MKLPIPKVLERRLKPIIDRWNTFLREFEWTWTKAVVFSLGFWIFAIVSTSWIPSSFLYLVEKAGWNRSFWLSKLGDAIGAGLSTGPVITVIIAGYLIQKQSRKVKGQAGDTRPSGGYR
ncbi:MAG: hypothetical protein WD770_06650 [Actinomycetota bacterium]